MLSEMSCTYLEIMILYYHCFLWMNDNKHNNSKECVILYYQFRLFKRRIKTESTIKISASSSYFHWISFFFYQNNEEKVVVIFHTISYSISWFSERVFTISWAVSIPFLLSFTKNKIAARNNSSKSKKKKKKWKR